MNDFDEAEKYLYNRKNKQYFFNTSLDFNLKNIEKIVALSEEYKLDEIKRLFEPTNGETFSVEYTCIKCGNISIDFFTKTKLFDYIHMRLGRELYGNRDFMCEKCKIEKKEIIYYEELKRKEDKAENFLKNTDYYIENYLSPDRVWKEGVTLWQKFNYIKNINADFDRIAEYIKNMNYKDFLQTLYWKTIAEKKRSEAKYKCQLCGKSGFLAVHHRTYSTHGYEHQNMNDLIVLCNDCHEKFHDIK